MRANLYRAYSLNLKDFNFFDSIVYMQMNQIDNILTLKEMFKYYPELDVWMSKDRRSNSTVIIAPETSQYFNLALLISRYNRSILWQVSDESNADKAYQQCINILNNTWKTFYKYRHAK
jgi:hypothetical protein